MLREFMRVLPSGAGDELAAPGNYIYLKNAAAAIVFETQNGDRVTLQQGQGIRFTREFKTVRCINEHDLQQGFKVLIGQGEFQNNALVGTVGAALVPGAGLNGLPLLAIDGQPQQVPGNALRRQLVIRAANSNAGVIWIGSTAVNVGLPLVAGDAAELDIANALELIGTNAGDLLYLAEVIA